jgi:hypothetical protein
MTREEREQRYRTAPPKQQFLYASEEAGAMLYKIFTDYHLPSTVYREYALAFGDVVLGFEPEERLPQVLMERLRLSEKMATIIAHDLLEYINSTPKDAGGAPEAASAPTSTIASVPQPESMPLPPERPTVPPPAIEPAAPYTPKAPEAAEPQIPNYRRPMTDIPRYVKDDPYREPPR